MTRGGYRFVGAWLGACVLGGLLNAGLQLIAIPKVYEVIGFSPTPASGLNGGLLFERLFGAALFAGFTVGLAGFVLGRRLRLIELPWLGVTVGFAVVASVASFAIESQLAFAAVFIVPSAAASWSPAFPIFTLPFIFGGFSGLFIGLGQAILLGRYVRFAGWWIAVSCVAFGLAAGTVAITNWLISGAGTRITGPNDYLAQMFASAIGRPLIIGLVSGIVLIRLLGNERGSVSTVPGGSPRA